MYIYLFSINVEWAYGDETAKYVTKYAMKGVDMAFVAVKAAEGVANVDEFHELNLARYVTSQEAMMAILGMPLVKMSHPVSLHFLHLSQTLLVNTRYMLSMFPIQKTQMLYTKQTRRKKKQMNLSILPKKIAPWSKTNSLCI